MVEKIILFCKMLIEKFIASSKRFPETILLSTGIVIILCIKNHGTDTLTWENIDLLDRISMVLGLGIPVSLSMKVFFERRSLVTVSIKTMIYGAGIGGLWLYYTYLLPDMHLPSFMRYVAVTISFYCMFFFIPYFYKKDNYELYIINLVSKFCITYLYSVILYAGLAAMLATINALFLFEISYKVYYDIGLIVIGIFAPVFFLSDIPENHDKLTLSCYPKVLNILLLYIVMPLLTAYSITLYVYFAKILIMMQWPEGIVSNLVMWYSLISIGVVFAIYPLRDVNQWAKRFIYWFPILVLPLLAMMFVALSIRINAYGITENRYFLFITGLWLVACMIYFITIKTPRTIVLFISVAILSLLSVMGPWSCFAISTASQSMRFEKIISKYDIVEDGRIYKISQEISADDKQEIGNIISYFNKYRKLNALKFIPENFTIDQMKTVFGFSEIGGNTKYFHHGIKEQDQLINISGFDYLFQVPSMDTTVQKNEMPISVLCTGKNGEVKIMKMGQVIYTKNINDIAIKIHAGHTTADSLQKDEMIFIDENENVKVLYIIKSISGTEENEGTTVHSMDFYLLVKVKLK